MPGRGNCGALGCQIRLFGQRNGPTAGAALDQDQLVTPVQTLKRVSDVEFARLPVNVAPPEPELLALPQPGVEGDHGQPTEARICDRLEHLSSLVGIEANSTADWPVHRRRARSPLVVKFNKGGWVALRPSRTAAIRLLGSGTD